MGRVTDRRVNGMNAAKSWSIKGVDESLRETAKRVAQSRGMTLGEWINEIIRREAEGGISDAAAAQALAAENAPPQNDLSGTEAIVRKLDELGTQLRALAAREQETAAGRLEPQEPQALAALIARIEENERQAAQALDEINARLDELARRLQEGAPSDEVTARQGELETALHNVLQHLDQYEKRTSGTFEQLRQRLEQVAAQTARAMELAENARAEGSGSEEIRQLEERLTSLTRRLAEIQQEAEARARAYVDESVSSLAQRVEAVHAASQELPGKVESLVTEVTGQRLAQVETQIERMVGSLREKLETIAGSVIDVDRIGSRIEELDRKLAEVSETAARRAEMEAIRAALDKLSAVVDDKADRKDVEAIVQRLDEMAEKLAQARNDLAADPAFAALDARVAELEARLREAMEKNVGPEIVQRLEESVHALKERLQVAEEQLSYLPQLENSVARLFQSIEATNEETRRIVEETARQFMEEKGPLAFAGQGENGTAPGTGCEDAVSSEEIEALKKGLEAVRQASEEADARTQETLAAVHETLERIVARLAEIEEEQKTLANRTGEMAEKLIDYTTTATATAAAAAMGVAGQAAAMPPGDSGQGGAAAAAGESMAASGTQMPASQATAQEGDPHIDPSDILAAINAVEGQTAAQSHGTGPSTGATAFGPAGMNAPAGMDPSVGMPGLSPAGSATAGGSMPGAQPAFGGGTGMDPASNAGGMAAATTPLTGGAEGAGPGDAPAFGAGPQGADAVSSSMDMHMEAPDDFIAAARRAAMAAAGVDPAAAEQVSAAAGNANKEKDGFGGLLNRFRRSKDGAGQAQTPEPGPEGPVVQEPGAEEKAGSSSFFGSLFGKTEKDEAGAPGNAAGTETDKKGSGLGRKPLLVAGASLLLAVLAWTYTQNMNKGATVATATEAAQPAVADEAAEAVKTNGKTGAKATTGQKTKKVRNTGKERRSDAASAERSLAWQPPASGMGASAATTAAIGGLMPHDAPGAAKVAHADDGAAEKQAPATADMIQTGTIASTAKDKTAKKEPSVTTGTAVAGQGETLPDTLGTPALREAALKGDGKAAYIVGMHYLTGQDVEKSPARAATWLTRAAAKGIVPAQYRLGTLYERGLGLKKDLAKARAWYEKAAKAGNVKAMHNLAVVLAGAMRDYAEAAKWFRMAAEHGLRDSQYNLAVLHERGLGVHKDLAEAYYWYGLAARQKDADAAQRMSVLAARLPAEKVKALKKRIAAFAPRKPAIEANFVAIDNPAWRKDAAAAAATTPLTGGSGQTQLQKAAASASSAAPEAGDSGKGVEIIRDATEIRRLQELLARIGYDPGPADGKMGPRTANAIRLFQLQMGLKVNGQPTRQVLSLLERRARAATQGTPGA